MGNELVTKEVEFNGDSLMVAQDNETGKIYVGVRWVCNGLGLSRGQINNENYRIQNDFVLKLGCTKFSAGVFDENNDTIAIELDYLPLWLAKISITPKMIEEKPEVAQKLVNYQIKAQKVLAQAFIHKDNVTIDNFHIPTTLSEALQLSAHLAKENEEMKPKAEQFDLYLQSDGTLSMNKVAKELKARRNKLMSFLRYMKVFNQDNSPSSYYADKEYFVVKSMTVVTKYGKKFNVSTTTVTPKGQDFLYRFLKKNKDTYAKFDNKYLSRLEVSANA